MSVELVRSPKLKTVATYRRAIGASIERVWENVYDWEHLPWLHSSSFEDIRCDDAGEWGWRAQVVYPGGEHRSQIELLTDITAGHYVTRVLDGPGAGGEVWTTLRSADARVTDIVVEFCAEVPEDVDPESMGAGYLALYEQLWNEDEQMMQDRQRELDQREARPRGQDFAPIELGTRDEVREQLPLRVEAFGSRVQIVDIDGEWVVHSLVCPHLLGPLDEASVTDGEIECPWHGYRFDLRSGRSCDGKRLRLAEVARLEIDDATDRVRLVAV